MPVEFIYEPNWTEPYNVSLSFLTQESISRIGIRQRGSLRQRSQKSFEYSCLLRGKNASSALHKIKNNQNDTYYVANFQVPRYVTSKSVTSYTEVTVVNGDNIAFEPISIGDRICIYASDNDYSLGVVTNVSASTVDGVSYKTYRVASVLSWITSEPDVFVFKVYEMLPTINQSDWVTDDHLNLRIRWTPAITSTYEPQVYDLPELSCYPDQCFICDAKAVFPMYQNPCGSAYPPNTIRPVFRGADLALPDKLYIAINQNKVSQDSNHSYSESLDGLISALEEPFELDYDPDFAQSVSTSRHWHHLNVVTIASVRQYSFGTPTVSRSVWSTTRNYIGHDGESYEMELRFVAEGPTYDGVQDVDSVGAWGTLFHIYLFSNEINPTYVDGDDFGGIAFYRDDPCVYDNEDRYCHPQLAFVAHIPTTIQQSCKYAPYDPYQKTRKACYVNSVPGMPWTGGTLSGSQNASVFGPSVEKALTLEAGCQRSYLFKHVTCENWDGSGLTALQTNSPGWDPETGTIYVSEDNKTLLSTAVSVKPRCNPKILVEDCCFGNRSGTENQAETITPYVGSNECITIVGGGGYENRTCCFSTSSRIKLTIEDRCVEQVVLYDEICAPTSVTEAVHGSVSKTIYLDVFSASYLVGDTGQQIVWKYRSENPDYVHRDYEDDFDDDSLGDMEQTIGVWTAADDQAKLTSPASGDWDGGLLTYSESFYDFTISAKVLDPSKPAGLFGKIQNATSSNVSCIFGQVDPINNTVGIYKLDEGVLSTLVEGTLDNVTFGSSYAITLTVIGTTVSFGSLEGNFLYTYQLCDLSGWEGTVGIGHRAGNYTQQFDDLSILDGDTTYAYAVVQYDDNVGWSFDIDNEMMPGYGEGLCEDVNPDCGIDPECSCSQTTRQYLMNDEIPGNSLNSVEPGNSWAFGDESPFANLDCDPGEQDTGYPITVLKAEVLDNSCDSGSQDKACWKWTWSDCTSVG